MIPKSKKTSNVKRSGGDEEGIRGIGIDKVDPGRARDDVVDGKVVAREKTVNGTKSTEPRT